MSQWGAYGFASRGWTYDRILAHYYRGTTLGAAPVARVRVLLGEGRASVRVVVARPVRACAPPAGRRSSSSRRPTRSGRACACRAGRGRRWPGRSLFAPGAEPLLARRQALPRPARGRRRGREAPRRQRRRARGLPRRRRPGRGPVGLAGRGAEGAGRRRALVRARRLAAPGPSTSTPTCAARSTAASAPRSRRRPPRSARRRARSLLYAGKVAQTFFFSTSGGRTASAADTWSGRAGAVPRLGRRPVRRRLAAPRWGPVAFTGARAREEARREGDARSTCARR